MKKVLLLCSGILLFSCADKTQNYVTKSEFELLKKEVMENRAGVKQSLASIVEIKKAFKEVNKQLEKQNHINAKIFDEIEDLKEELKQIRKENKKYTKKGIILGNLTNVRESPSLSGKVIAKVNKGQIVEILKKEGNWYKVRLSLVEGYIYKSLIKEIN